MDNLIWDYQLNDYEIEEALLCLEGHGMEKSKKIYNILFSIVGVITLFAYTYSPSVLGIVVLVFIIAFVFYTNIGVALLRRRRIRKPATEEGYYHLELAVYRLFFGEGDNQNMVDVKNEYAMMQEGEKIFLLQAKQMLIVLPKRVLRAGQDESVRNWALSNQIRIRE